MDIQKHKSDSAPLLDKIIRWHIFALILLIPLFFWVDTQTIFTLPKLLLLRVFSLSAGVCLLLKLFLEKEITLIFPRRVVFLGLWSISLILSTIFSLNHFTSLWGQYGRFLGLITLLNLLLIPVYLASFLTPSQRQKLIDFSIFTSVLVAIYGLLQYFDFFGWLSFQSNWSDSPQNRVFATIGHANHLGAYLAAHFLMLIYRLNFSGLNIWKLIGQLAILLLQISVLLLTASRGAVLALVIAALMLLFLKTHKHWRQIKVHLGKTLGVLLALLLVTLAGLFLFSEKLGELSLIRRTEQSISTLEKGKIPDRLSFLYSSWRMFLDHPLLGTGLSTFRDSYSAYRRTDYFIDGPGNVQFITIPESAHNEYANILATQGILGFITYLAMILAILDLLLKKYRQSPASHENWYLLLLGGLSVFLIQTIFNFGELVNLFVFYLLIGIILAEEDNPARLKIALPQWLNSLIIIVVMILGFFGFKYGVWQVMLADINLKKAHLAQLNRQYELADKLYLSAVSNNPWEYLIFQSYADFSLEAGVKHSDKNISERYLKQAVGHYQGALQLNSNYPSTYHNLGLAYLHLFRLTGNKTYADLSRESYLRSIEKSPNNPRYLYEYARKLHSDWNDHRGAVELLKKALQITPDYQEPQDYLDFLYKNHPELRNPLK